MKHLTESTPEGFSLILDMDGVTIRKGMFSDPLDSVRATGYIRHSEVGAIETMDVPLSVLEQAENLYMKRFN